MSLTNRVLNSAANVTGKAAVGLARWATSDHTGLGDALARMPSMGFWDTIKYTSMLFAISLASIALSGALMFVLIAFGIPLFFSLMLGG